MQEVALKKCWMWCYFKKTLKEMETVRFRSSEQWQIFKPGTGIAGPMIYLDEDHISSSTTSLWKNAGVWSCRNLLPNSAFCWLIPCVLPVSTKEMQHCHFNAAFWPALTSSFRDLKAEQRLSKKLDLEHI